MASEPYLPMAGAEASAKLPQGIACYYKYQNFHSVTYMHTYMYMSTYMHAHTQTHASFQYPPHNIVFESPSGAGL